MADPQIKPDPGALPSSPSPFADEDIYEDAGDLEFNNTPEFQSLYIVRLPKYLWANWSKLDDDAEIQLGTIRMQEEKKGTHGKGPGQSLQMLLRSDLAIHQGIPKEYNLDISSETVNNTFVFTEKDLPGFTSRARTKFDPATANMPTRLNRARIDKNKEKKPWDPSKPGQSFVRKAVPKKTTLAGRIRHDVNAIPVDNEESRRLIANRTRLEMQPKAATIYAPGAATGTGTFVQAGTMQAMGAFGGFIKNTGTAKGRINHELKTARIPEDQLLDLIFGLFKEYAYWSMKSLRARLQQPEAYIRETLEKVADMPRSGPFAMLYTLKPAFKEATTADDGVAPVQAGGADGVDDSDMADIDGDDDDDDEDINLEDVMP